MNTKQAWLEYCWGWSGTQADFYSGCRKILRGRQMLLPPFDDSLTLHDCGFTTHKLRALQRLYFHEESIAAAVQLWDSLRVRDKYGSAGAHCYAHLIKGLGSHTGERTSKRASVMGPCIQSMVLTYIDKRRFHVDLFYRTTELLKKFPADLVFVRDIMLPKFNTADMTLEGVTCHFANVTVHPMYWATLFPLLPNVLDTLAYLKQADPYFHDWVVKWSARYVCDEFHRGIAKFAQALRVQKDVRSRLSPELLVAVQEYLRAQHPPLLRTRFTEEIPPHLQGVSHEVPEDEAEEDDD